MVRRFAASLVVLALVVAGIVGLSRSGQVGAQSGTAAATMAATGGSPAACQATTADENKDIVQRYITAFDNGDQQTMDALLADNVTYDLSRDGITVNNQPGNADELSHYATAGAGNIQFNVDDVFASGDEVAVRFSYQVSSDQVPGAAAGKTANVTGIAIVRIQCGMIQQVWQEHDALGLLMQLGLTVGPAGTPAP